MRADRHVLVALCGLGLAAAPVLAEDTSTHHAPPPPLPPPATYLLTPAPLVGDDGEAIHRLHYDLACLCVRAQAHVALDGRAGVTSSFALDRDRTPSATTTAVSPRARIGLTVAGPIGRSVGWRLEYEQDVPTGSLDRTLPDGLAMPDSDGLTAPLRKASLWLTVKPALIVGAGVMTSHWGLGLVANDGAHGWEPGSARFVDPRGGDRVLRGFVASGPHRSFGLVGALAVERVLDDDALLTADEQRVGSAMASDTVNQALASITVGAPTRRWAGAYVASRRQHTADDRDLTVTAFDVATIGHRQLRPDATLSYGAEVAYLHGDTTFAPTVTHPSQRVRQLGATARAGLDLGRWGAALDGVFASGDDNLDDDQQLGFHANHNFDLGLILFPQVLAAQSARSVHTAGDPALVGQPVTGVERLPTRGAVGNTIAVFPRLFVRPARGVELYGGALVAWSAVPLVDPFNTMIAGGARTNATGGAPGSFLGVEADLGLRARALLWGTVLSIGLEAGVLLPGSAFRDATDSAPSSIKSARLMLGTTD